MKKEITENYHEMQSPLSTNENSPIEHKSHTPVSANSLSKESTFRTYVKLKTLSSNGEWIIPEKKNYYDDLNTILQENNIKMGHFNTPQYDVYRTTLTNDSRNSLKLHYSKISPHGPLQAQICFVHGFENHSGRFFSLGEFFAKNGFLVHLIDLNGFGNSELSQETRYSITEYHKDVECLLENCSEHLPLFLLGYGMGAGVLLSLLIRNPRLNIAGVIITSAMVKCPEQFKTNYFSNLVLNAMGKKEEDIFICSKINPSALCKNNYRMRNYLSNDEWNEYIPLKLVKELSNLEEFLLPNAFKFHYPLLTLLSMNDSITNYHDSYMFHVRSNSRYKTYKAFENGYHNLFDDNEADEAKKFILKWCEERLNVSKINYNHKKLIVGLPSLNRKKRAFRLVLAFCFAYLLKSLKTKSLQSISIFMKIAQNKLGKSFLLKLLQVMNMLLQPFKI